MPNVKLHGRRSDGEFVPVAVNDAGELITAASGGGGEVGAAAVNWIINEGGVPATGQKTIVQIPYAATVTGWSLTTSIPGGFSSGDVQLWVFRAPTPDAGFPTLDWLFGVDSTGPSPGIDSSAVLAQSDDVSGWTKTAIEAMDFLGVYVESVDTLTGFTFALLLDKG